MRRFVFRLALALGATVAELEQRMGVLELTEWMAYYQIEPFGEERADLRAGIVAATVANTFRGKNSKAAAPQDFMPFRQDGPARPADGDTLKRKFMMLTGHLKHDH